jgi:hypothetical protein
MRQMPAPTSIDVSVFRETRESPASDVANDTLTCPHCKNEFIDEQHLKFEVNDARCCPHPKNRHTKDCLLEFLPLGFLDGVLCHPGKFSSPSRSQGKRANKNEDVDISEDQNTGPPQIIARECGHCHTRQPLAQFQKPSSTELFKCCATCLSATSMQCTYCNERQPAEEFRKPFSIELLEQCATCRALTEAICARCGDSNRLLSSESLHHPSCFPTVQRVVRQQLSNALFAKPTSLPRNSRSHYRPDYTNCVPHVVSRNSTDITIARARR